jgi:Peptidase A4 family
MSTEAGQDLPYEVTPTNLPGAYASVVPLDDFDPRTAAPAELARHGIMVRPPGPDDPAAARAAWDTVFSRVWRAQDRVIPTLEPQVGRTHKPRGVKRVGDASFTSDNWSGATIQGDWTLAIGYWVVPTVTEPGEPQGLEGGWNSSSWVGIDGAYGSDDVLQAGVEQRVDSSGNASYTAWFEWFAPRYPNSPAYIFQTNIGGGFTVSPGDTVYCAAQYGGQEASAAIPGSPLDGYATDWNQQQHVNYIGVDGHVHEFYTAAGNWQYNDLSAAAGATGFRPGPGSPLDGYATGWNSQQHVNYIGADGHAHELVYSNGTGWQHNDLSAAAGATGFLPRPGSPLDGYTTDWNSQQHVNYIGADGHVHELVYFTSPVHNAGWRHNDLSAAAGATGSLPGPGSPLDGYTTDWTSQQHVNYIGADGHVHELVYSSSRFGSAGWQHNDLSAAAGATGSLPGRGSRLDGYATDWNSQQHVNYADANGQVHELLYTSSNGWQHNDLTALAGQSEFGPFTFPGAVAASPLAGDPTNWNSQQHVTYIGVDGHVHELNNAAANGSGANGGWEENDLTAVAGRTGVIYFANDTTHHYFSITLEPPPAASCSGACAEWIMEAPDGGEPTSSLPKFNPVTFTSAICCGPDGLGNPENGDTWNIVTSGTTLTSVKTGDDTVTIDYIGP